MILSAIWWKITRVKFFFGQILLSIMLGNGAEIKNFDNITGRQHLTEQQIIQELINSKFYDHRIRPTGGDNFGQTKLSDKDAPVYVKINMYLRTISKVDDVNMEYSLHFTFREEWIDERLQYNGSSHRYINLSPGQKIWMPDTFFQNEKEGRKHNIDTPNVLIRVFINQGGRILYSVRMTLTLSCPMNLQNYPMDTQECFVDLASYAYTTHDIIYIWKEIKPIQIKKGLKSSLPSFTLSDVKTGNCTSVTNTGAYSCLRTILALKREFSYYLLQLYIPSFMLVAVSWVSFWLDKDSVPARVTLGVTTLLTMTTQAGGINAKLPPVSYTKAIDVWIGVCLAFIFGALLEFALVNYAARKDMLEESKKRRLIEKQSRAQEMNLPAKNFLSLPTNMSNNPRLKGNPQLVDVEMQELEKEEKNYFTQIYRNRSVFSRMWNVKYRAKAKRIDVLSRILFPIAFFIFNAVYWVKYITPYMAVKVKVNL